VAVGYPPTLKRPSGGLSAACRLILGVGFCLSLSGHAQPSTVRQVPLPDVTGVIELRAAYAHNPRFAPLTPEQQQSVLRHAALAVKEHLGLQVRFTPVQMVPLRDLFASIPPPQRDKAEGLRLDPGLAPSGLDSLAKDLQKAMQADGNLAGQREFALPHLLQPPADAGDLALAKAIVQTQHQLLTNWSAQKALDGQPMIGSDRFNEYTYWIALGASPVWGPAGPGAMAVDVVLTNQLIASAEKQENSVHSALRGGVSNGITTQSLGARHGLYTVVSAYPFFDNCDQTRMLRGGAHADSPEAERQMGYLLAHELGHVLLHLGHPFGNAACVMTPPQRLEFAKWVAGLDASRCPLGGSKPNSPGFFRFTAPRLLFGP
jgi:hypothetical protein